MSEQLKYRMQQHEEAPPAGVWEAIHTRLDDDINYSTVATKMTAFETTPPANAWDGIVSALDGQAGTGNTDVVPFRRRNKVYRLAAAAVIIGIAITGWWMMNRNNGKQPNIIQGNDVAAANILPSGSDDTMSNGKEGGAQPDSPTEGMAFSSARASSRRLASNDRTLKYATAVNYPSYNNEYPIIINSTPVREEASTVVREHDIQTMNGDYLIISAPNGDRTKISAKFANVIRYLNDDETSDEGEAWKKRFQEWRRKIMQSAFIPSSGNFLDIADLKELLEEKQ
jgi:hypothetical protein